MKGEDHEAVIQVNYKVLSKEIHQCDIYKLRKTCGLCVGISTADWY